MKIGFFDSGLGGLTIMDAVRAAMPQYDYHYYGDTAHVPYGDKTEAEVYELTKAGVTHLFEQGALIVIIACNTASAETLRKLQDTFLVEAYPDRRILGMIIPTIETLLAAGSTKPLLIGTKRTVDSGKYQIELDKVSETHIALQSLATPTLVPYLEAKSSNKACAELTQLLHAYAHPFDALILGCTHYTILTDCVRNQYGDQCVVLSQDEIIPTKLQEYLSRHPTLEHALTKGRNTTCYYSGASHTI